MPALVRCGLLPVEFLADEEAAAYGAYRAVPSRPDLEKLFFLDDVDGQLVGNAVAHTTGSGSRCC